MPTRYIDDSLLTKSEIDELNSFEEVCYFRLLVTVDDFGRYFRDPIILRNTLFPRKREVTIKEVDAALNRLEEVSLIETYQVKGERYLHFCGWNMQYVRAKTSKFPSPEMAEDTETKNRQDGR